MTSANATPERRRREAACPRAMQRGARHSAARARAAPRRRPVRAAAFGALVVAGAAIGAARPAAAQEAIVSPRAACLDAVRGAERDYGLPRGLLVAVALNESGLHAYALNIRGRAYFPSSREDARRLYFAGLARGAVMAGCVQVNARVHARGSDWPLDPRIAADWAARQLRDYYERTGSWTGALARWQGRSPAGARQLICRVRGKLEATAPDNAMFEGVNCGRTEVARVRRDGVALLELAEASER